MNKLTVYQNQTLFLSDRVLARVQVSQETLLDRKPLDPDIPWDRVSYSCGSDSDPRF